MARHSAVLEKGGERMTVSFAVRERGGRAHMSMNQTVQVEKTTNPNRDMHPKAGRLLAEGWGVTSSTLPVRKKPIA